MNPSGPLYPVGHIVEIITPAIAKDLSDRGILTEDRVLSEPVSTLKDALAPRIWIELAPNFTVEPAIASRVGFGPGMTATVQGVDVATRPVLNVLETIVITILAKAPEPLPEDPQPDPPKYSRSKSTGLAAQTACMQLRTRVLGTLYRVLQGNITSIQGEWLKPETREMQYGSALRMTLVTSTPVPDDTSLVVKPDGEFDMTAVFPESEYLANTVLVTL